MQVIVLRAHFCMVNCIVKQGTVSLQYANRGDTIFFSQVFLSAKRNVGEEKDSYYCF